MYGYENKILLMLIVNDDESRVYGWENKILLMLLVNDNESYASWRRNLECMAVKTSLTEFSHKMRSRRRFTKALTMRWTDDRMPDGWTNPLMEMLEHFEANHRWHFSEDTLLSFILPSDSRFQR